MHGKQGENNCQKTQCIEKKTRLFANSSDQDACQGRTDETGAIHYHGIQRYGIAYILVLFNHLHDERLARGDIQCVHATEKNAQEG